MINKLVLMSNISKYHLGEVESVKWIVKDKTLNISFMSITKEVIGTITHSSFNMEDCELAIFDTKKLISLLSITQGDLLLDVEKHNNRPTKLHISDTSFNLTYALADPLLIGKVGTVNEPEWDATLELNSDDIDNLVKAKSALKDVNNMLISVETDEVDNLMCLFTFGDENGHNNKITYQIYGEIKPTTNKIPFNSDMLRNILHANKDMESGTLYLNYNGLIKLKFTTQHTSCEYYLVRKEQNSF
jgi:hypothetical protein